MSDGKKIFVLTYHGTRFNNAHLPVEVLSDLPAFRDLLISYARDEWLKRNQNKKRVPKGFEESFSFDLIGIQPGSAITNIEWNRPTAQQSLPGFIDQIEEILDSAYEHVVSLIGTPSEQAATLSPEKIRALNRFGAGLRDNEKIEIPDRDNTNVVYLDTERRRQLITSSREDYSTRYEGIGLLTGTHIKAAAESDIRILTEKYGEISIRVDPARIHNEFDGNLESLVQFHLLIELDKSNRFRRVTEIFDIGVVDIYDPDFVACRKRINELRNLEAGWYDEDSVRIASTALGAVLLFCAKYSQYCGLFHIYPTEAGGVLVDFERNGWDFSVEFDSAGGIKMYGISTSDQSEMEPKEFPGLDGNFYQMFAELVANGG